MKKFLPLLLFAALCFYPNVAYSATGCSYPTSADSWSDKATNDFLTVADVNERTCAIEAIETLLGTSTGLSGGVFIFNDDGADVDLRVEGDNNANMILMNAGQDALSFGGANVDGAAIIFNNLTDRTAITSVGTQVHMPAQTQNFDNGSGTIAIGAPIFVGIQTWTGDSATLTVTDLASVYIQGVPVDSTNVTATNGPYAMLVKAGDVMLHGGAYKVIGPTTVQAVLERTGGAASGPFMDFYHNSDSPGDNDTPMNIDTFAEDDGSTKRRTGRIQNKFEDVTATTMDSSYAFSVMNNVNAGNAATIATLTSAGVWTDAPSFAEFKTFEDFTPAEVLAKIKTLSVRRFRGKGQPDIKETERHISPTADDFYNAFKTGKDPRVLNSEGTSQYGIAARDVAGVALMGVQALLTRVEVLEAR